MNPLRWYDFITTNIYWFALNVTNNGLGPVMLPVIVQALVPASQKNSYLGLVTFLGLIVAVLVNPIMGAVSDRSTLPWGRRKPFVVAGTLLDLVFLGLLLVAGNIWVLLGVVLLLQFSSNTAQGPLQALIPDVVPAEQRGTASGVKALFEITGAVVGSVAAGFLVGRGLLPAAMGFTMVVLLLSALVMAFTVRESRGSGGGISIRNTVINTFNVNLRGNRDYGWWLLNRLLFFVGLTTIQTFLLFFLQDVLQVSNPAAVAGNAIAVLGVATVVVALPIGYLADRVGRKPLMIAAGLTATVGGMLFPFAQNEVQLFLFGSLIGLSAGVFISAGWALATDLVPLQEAGRYLGISNLATAGGGALARLGGPIIDLLNSQQHNLGYTVVFFGTGVCFLLATLALLRVHEPRRSRLASPPAPGG